MSMTAGGRPTMTIDDPAEAPLDPRETGTLAAVRRHWPLIAGLATLAVTGTLLLCQVLTPLYSSRAIMMIDPHEPKQTVSKTDPLAFMPPSETDVRKNEMAILRSRGLAERVIANLQLQRDPEFNPTLRRPSLVGIWLDRARHGLRRIEAWAGLAADDGKMTAAARQQLVHDKVVAAFLRHLVISTAEAPRVIDIRFTSRNPERAALVANAVATEYIAEKHVQDVRDAEAESRALSNEIDKLNAQTREAEVAIEKMRNDNGPLPAATLKVLRDRVSDLNRQLAAAAGQSAANEARLAELQKARATGQIDSLASVLNAPLIQQLRGEAARLESKISGMATFYRDASGRMGAPRAELSALRARIAAEIEKIAVSYQHDLDTSRAKEAKLRQLVASTRAEMAKATISEIDVDTFERKADASKALMGQLVSRLIETRVQMDRKVPAARVISVAETPRLPSFPPRAAMLAVALLVSTTVGVTIAMLLERRDLSVRSTAQLRQMTPAPVLGVLPALRRAARLPQSPPARVLLDRRSMFVENLRALWFRIDHGHGLTRTVVITSSVPGEGKTSIATSLARLLAMSGRRVVIVDADLRYPSVHRVFALRRSPGLSEWINDSVPISEVLQKDRPSGACVVSAGRSSVPPADILQSPRVATLLAMLSGQFDFVIIDSPPVLAVHDAGIIAQLADLTVVAVRWGKTPATALGAALQRLHDFDIQMTGVMLTRVDERKYAKYSYGDSEAFSRQMRRYASD